MTDANERKMGIEIKQFNLTEEEVKAVIRAGLGNKCTSELRSHN